MKIVKIATTLILAFVFLACNAPEQKKVEDSKPDAPKSRKERRGFETSS